jgi:two-component system nitrogen regulation sensor histidine kinase GlnL
MTPAASPYQWIVPLFAALANMALCAFVYSSDKKNPFHQTFSLFCLTVVLWNLDIFSLDYASTAEEAFFWSRLFRVGMLLMPPTFLHCAIIFAQTRSRWVRAILLFNYAIATALVIANAFDLLVSHVERLTWGYYPRPQPFYSIHTTSFGINAALAFGLVTHAYRYSPAPRVRLQARFWLLGLAMGLPLGATNLLAVYGVPVYPLGSLGSVAFTAVVSYAIVRHRLMDVDVAVTKGVAYILGTIVAIAPVFVFALWMQNRIFGRVNADFSTALLVSYFFVAALFPLLSSRTETRIGQSLFREKHEYRAALAGFTSTIVRILDREKLLRELADTLIQVLQLDRVAIFLQGPDQAYHLQHKAGIAPTTEEFAKGDVLVRLLAQRGETVLRDELEAGAASSELATIRDLYRANGWEVSMPLTMSGRLVGFVNLGRKRNLALFSSGDLELLNTLAAEAAIALENARLYEELKKSQDIIRRADRLSALGTLAAGIAHEIRNPLVSIQTFFQLAPERLHDHEFSTTFLNTTAGEVKRIANLITELLSFARSPTRAFGPTDLNQTVERVLTLLEPEAKKQKLALTRALAPTLPLVRADGDQVKQVLINLVLNAIQATEPGGGVSISSRTVRNGNADLVQLEVRDTGAGIPPEHLDEIFNPFFTTKAKGTGLGLPIAHQIVTEHGGSMTVESREGRGTTVFVNLPAYVEEAVSALAGKSVAAVESGSLSYALRRKAAS